MDSSCEHDTYHQCIKNNKAIEEVYELFKNFYSKLLNQMGNEEAKSKKQDKAAAPKKKFENLIIVSSPGMWLFPFEKIWDLWNLEFEFVYRLPSIAACADATPSKVGSKSLSLFNRISNFKTETGLNAIYSSSSALTKEKV